MHICAPSQDHQGASYLIKHSWSIKIWTINRPLEGKQRVRDCLASLTLPFFFPRLEVPQSAETLIEGFRIRTPLRYLVWSVLIRQSDTNWHLFLESVKWSKQCFHLNSVAFKPPPDSLLVTNCVVVAHSTPALLPTFFFFFRSVSSCNTQTFLPSSMEDITVCCTSLILNNKPFSSLCPRICTGESKREWEVRGNWTTVECPMGCIWYCQEQFGAGAGCARSVSAWFRFPMLGSWHQG